MRLLFDTNIVLDVLLGRVPWHVEAGAIFQAAREGKLTASVTTLCIANVFYVGRRLAGSEKAMEAVCDCTEAIGTVALKESCLFLSSLGRHSCGLLKWETKRCQKPFFAS